MEYIKELSKKNIIDLTRNDLMFLCDLSLMKGEKKLPIELKDTYYKYSEKTRNVISV